MKHLVVALCAVGDHERDTGPVTFGERLDDGTSATSSIAPVEVVPDRPLPIDPRAFLELRNVQITHENSQTIIDENTVMLANYIGGKYDYVADFVDLIKKSAVNNRVFSFVLTERPADLPYVTQLGNKLHECGFLQDYAYLKTARTVRLRANTDGVVQNFFNGAWFEIYTHSVVSECIAQHSGALRDYQILKGACITLRDGSQSEIDLLIGIDPERVVWVECKTGKWQDFTERYKHTGDILGLGAEEAALVLLKKPGASACKTASTLTDMTVLGVRDFRTWFEARLGVTSNADDE